MEYTKEQIINALRTVIYPGSGKDIVTLKMIGNISTNTKKISFSLLSNKKKDPFIKSIKKACIQAIHKNIDPNLSVEININETNQAIKEKQVLPGIKNIIAIASGKGGVGKSTVAVNLAVAMAKHGFKTGLLDADIYGPSIPKMFNTENTIPSAREIDGKTCIIPLEKYGVKILSIGYFIKPQDALVWRGPMATNAIRQLINDVEWGKLEYLIIDLPPGTGDIHLTLVQEVPITGAIIVSTPQEIALADAVKGISMFQGKAVNVPVLGLVENMAWFTPNELPDKKYFIFGKDGCKKLSEKLNIPLLGQIPIFEKIRENGDKGYPVALDEEITGNCFITLAEKVIERVDFRNRNFKPTKKVEIKNK